MHNNYYFLKALSKSLLGKLTGYKLVASFSQEKNELVLSFLDNISSFYIKASLQPDFSSLYFPLNFARANRNTADIFEEAIGLRVVDVIQYNQERAFGIVLEEGYTMVFKLFGNRSNVVLFKDGFSYKLFKNSLTQDKNLKLSDLDRSLDQDFQTFQEKSGDFKAIYPTFGKIVVNRLNQRVEDLDVQQKYEAAVAMHNWLENADEFYVAKVGNIPVLSLIAEGDILFRTHDPIEALNSFYIAYTKDYYLEREKLKTEKHLEQVLQKTDSYIQKSSSKLREIELGMGYDKIADIIMANLHQIPLQKSVVELYDFYNDRQVKINLNKSLSPQKNAENYYRKSKNQKIEIENLKRNIAHKQEFALETGIHLEEIKAIASLKSLRQYMKTHGLSQTKADQEKELPFKIFDIEGWQVMVGKNARNNDLLTQKFSFKEDLWLHAKDVTGSHVLIKYKSGKKFPKYVIEKAAQLAAYYSQRKTDSLCPVIVTPKKFVRKPKGAAPGAVFIDKEEVILVQPTPYNAL